MRRYNNRLSQDPYFTRRPMNTIVELSAEQGRFSIDDSEYESEEVATSLTPFARGNICVLTHRKKRRIEILGTLTSVFSAITAISRKTGVTTVNIHETEPKKVSPIKEKISLAHRAR